jgi:hypothetical protein
MKVGLQPVPVIVLCDQFTCLRVEPQHRIRAEALHSVGSGNELLLLIKRKPVVGGCSCDARVVSVRGRCESEQ